MQRNGGHLRYVAALAALLAPLWVALAVNPHDRSDWLLENVLTVLAVGLLVASYRRFPLSRASYTLIFVFLSLHTVGAHYTYSEVPYDEAFRLLTGSTLNEGLGWERNNFDRVVHFAYGLLLAYPIRELFLRIAGVRGFWGYFLPLDLTMSTSMLYELIEWAAAVVLGGELGAAYLGTQGDVWDAHKDMALAMLGALTAMCITAFIHSRSKRDFAYEWIESLRVKTRALAVLVCSLAIGCTTLPEVGAPNPHLQSESPRVEASRGELSEARSEALLARQDKQREPTLLDRHLATMQRISDAPLVAGNAARLLIDGPASYQAIFAAIGAARDHVNVETYILEGDDVGDKLAALLIEKQAQGVQVNLLYDAVGSLGTSVEFFDRLRAGGVQVCAFNPLLPSRGRVADPNQRDHRKQVVVDGRVAISGGINFSSVYSSGSAIGRRTKPKSVSSGWRDTNIELRGPAVAKYQELFIATWEKQSCPPLAAREYFPALSNQGDKVVRVLGSSSDDERGLMYLGALSAIREARQSVYVTMAYFVPDAEICRALEDAARRGVEVKLILPGFSDSWVVLRAGHSYYAELLSAGVQIYELRGALLHAKTAVVDGVLSTVGSTNLDVRSFLYNDELNTTVLGEDFGRATTAMFEADLRDATRVDPARWQDRPIGDRLKERAARLFAAWL